jgi:hypothetical protein
MTLPCNGSCSLGALNGAAGAGAPDEAAVAGGIPALAWPDAQPAIRAIAAAAVERMGSLMSASGKQRRRPAQWGGVLGRTSLRLRVWQRPTTVAISNESFFLACRVIVTRSGQRRIAKGPGGRRPPQGDRRRDEAARSTEGQRCGSDEAVAKKEHRCNDCGYGE